MDEPNATPRADRRRHLARIKRNSRVRWGRVLTDREVGMAAHTPKPCSCWMCGNQRRTNGPNAQELRQLQRGVD